MAKSHLLSVAVLAVAAGLFTTTSLVAQNMNGNLGNGAAAAPLALPAGITAKELNSDKGIEKTFRDVTNDAIDTTGFDNLVSHLVDQDRERVKNSLATGRGLGDVEGDKNKAFKDVVTDLKSTWESKYNKKFDLPYKDVYTGGYISIMTGEVSDSSQLLDKWPLDAGRTPGPAAGKFNQNDVAENNKNFGGSVNLEKNREVAVARIMGMNSTGPLTASMIHQAGGWTFDIPNTTSADELYRTLVANLQVVDQQKANWPADINEAYRHVTDAVVASLYDINLSPTGGTAINK